MRAFTTDEEGAWWVPALLAFHHFYYNGNDEQSRPSTIPDHNNPIQNPTNEESTIAML